MLGGLRHGAKNGENVEAVMGKPGHDKSRAAVTRGRAALGNISNKTGTLSNLDGKKVKKTASVLCLIDKFIS